jgi:alpha-L-rhamnosidase
MNKLTSFILAVLLLAPVAALHAAEVASLRCEYRENPLGIDVAKPRLSWVLEEMEQGTGDRGQRQTAYQVLVASSEELLAKDHGDLWDSGKVASDQSIQIEYAGKPLESRQSCHWKVRVWSLTSDLRPPNSSPWSQSACWTMGLLKPDDWQAKWIGYDAAYQARPEAAADDKLMNIQGLKLVQVQGGKDGSKSCLRRRIELPEGRKVRRAVLALYAYNFCEAAVNGVPVGQAMHWDRTARLDVTKALRSGTNVVTLAVSHTDPYNPAVIGRLVLQFESGEDLVIPIDDKWKASQQAADGWEKPAFDDAAWAAAEVFDGTPWRGPEAVSDLARLPAPYLRKDFSIDQSVKRAMVYVTALGVYELHLNGKPVGNDVLAPGWTEFRKRVHYQTYDVTAQVPKGGNTLGAILGDGWYASTLAHLGRRNIYGGRPRFMA